MGYWPMGFRVSSCGVLGFRARGLRFGVLSFEVRGGFCFVKRQANLITNSHDPYYMFRSPQAPQLRTESFSIEFYSVLGKCLPRPAKAYTASRFTVLRKALTLNSKP